MHGSAEHANQGLTETHRQFCTNARHRAPINAAAGENVNNLHSSPAKQTATKTCLRSAHAKCLFSQHTTALPRGWSENFSLPTASHCKNCDLGNFFACMGIAVKASPALAFSRPGGKSSIQSMEARSRWFSGAAPAYCLPWRKSLSKFSVCFVRYPHRNGAVFSVCPNIFCCFFCCPAVLRARPPAPVRFLLSCFLF